MKTFIAIIVFFTLMFAAFLYSVNSEAASKRKIYIGTGTYATSNSDTVGIEATIWISNPSNVIQRISFDTSKLKMVVYAYSAFNYPQSFYNAFTPGFVGKWAALSVTPNGHNIDTGFSASSLASPIDLAPNETLEIKFYAKPYAGYSPFFGNLDFGRQHYASFYAGGNFMGQILLQGILEVEDVTTPGFVIGFGSILRPLTAGGANAPAPAEFQLNGGKPF